MSMRTEHGFTLIEILVAVGILGLVVAGVTQSFVVQNAAYTVVDQTTEAQQNARAVASLLERDLRMTGFMIPEGGALCGIDAGNATDVLYVTDADAIDPNGQSEADLGAAVLAGYTASASTQTLSLDSLSLDGVPFYDTTGSGGADADFRVGGGAIVTDTENPGRGTACGRVVEVNAGANTIRVEFETALGAGAGGSLVAIPAHRYVVRDPLDGIDDDGNGIVDDSTLTRDGVALVSDVDDLQIAVGIDANDDGTLDDATEYFGNGAANDYQAGATDHRGLREIRFNLVLRSRSADPRWTQGSQQATENRAAAGAADGFRRRVYTATVKPRNVGFRGSSEG